MKDKANTMGTVSDTEYVRATKDGFFIEGQPTKTYRGVLIHTPPEDYVPYILTKYLQQRGIQEIHCLTSETCGTKYKPGNPSGKHGANIWCRIKMIDETIGDWVFFDTACSSQVAALYCIKVLIDNIWAGKEFAMALLPKQTNLTEQRATTVPLVPQITR